MLSGHFHDGNAGEANRSDLNRCGEPVQQILTDYQDRANGGDGWLRYYTFDPAANTMTATHLLAQARHRSRPTPTRRSPLPVRASARPLPAPFATDRHRDGRLRRRGHAHLDRARPRHPRTSGAPSPSDGTTTHHLADLDGAHARRAADLVDDTFTRNVANGWGAPDAGQAWQLTSTRDRLLRRRLGRDG